LYFGVGQEWRNLPISKLRLFLLTAGNPLETGLFERAGRNEVGEASPFHHDQTDCETSRDTAMKTGISKIPMSEIKLGKNQYVGTNKT
jgi:hypothetical protein